MERPAPFRSNKCVGHPRWRGRSHIRKEPAVASVSHLAPTHLGLDVHKDTISVAILAHDRDGPDVERIPHDEASVRRLVGRVPAPRRLRACYEAGPTGFELARLLHSMGVGCQVIARRAKPPWRVLWRAGPPALWVAAVAATVAGAADAVAGGLDAAVGGAAAP
jgi:hypothetical protein